MPRKESPTAAPRRRGRPRASGKTDTRRRILDAAREQFATYGYAATTIRAIAAAAGVDPALVHHFYGAKADLFTASMQLPEDFVRSVSHLLLDTSQSAVGERLTRFFLNLWENSDTRRQLRMTVSSGLTDGQATTALREFVTAEILNPVVVASDRQDAALRLPLAVSHLIGLAMGRYILEIEPLAHADVDTLVAWVAPTIEHYLTGESPTR
ncbi:TetR family transcriptional regulator [Nocardia alni]|uniref:TetR/AcrR family transcriptional regulator n=1 Tax=Nocardia alni TaxID=2815723 RepID=UPI001C2272D3|nr:TetR family transcriptional regulator [Nocardia alni]